MEDKMRELLEMYSRTPFGELPMSEISGQEDGNLLPIAMKILAATIGKDLVSVQPLSDPGISNEKLEEIKREVKRENRNRKIDNIVTGEKNEEMKVEDHPDYSYTSGNLFYIDYQYSTQSGSL